MTGECKRCGSCCLYGQAFVYHITKDGDDELVFTFQGVNERMKDVIDPCQQLIFDIKTHEPICNIYEYRPSVCVRFPQCEGELIFKDCGYRR